MQKNTRENIKKYIKNTNEDKKISHLYFRKRQHKN